MCSQGLARLRKDPSALEGGGCYAGKVARNQTRPRRRGGKKKREGKKGKKNHQADVHVVFHAWHQKENGRWEDRNSAEQGGLSIGYEPGIVTAYLNLAIVKWSKRLKKKFLALQQAKKRIGQAKTLRAVSQTKNTPGRPPPIPPVPLAFQ